NIIGQLNIMKKNKEEYNRAIEYYEKALKIKLYQLGPYHIDIVIMTWQLNIIKKSLKILRCKVGSDHFLIVYQYKGEYNNAITYYKKSLKIILNKFGSNHPFIANSYNNLGFAIEYCNKLLKIILDKLGFNNIEVVNSYKNLALVYYDKQEYDKAMEFGKNALDLRLNKLYFYNSDIGNLYDILGYINYKKDEKMEAMKCYENTMSIYTKNFGENNKKTQEVILKLKNLFCVK
ncbi:hypothetical protein RFI_37469, partial [Reticulomyxa filosa]